MTRAPVSRIVKYVSGVLAIDPAPMVWLQEQGDGLRVANTVGLGADRQKLVPSLLVGAPLIGKADERELAFEVGKRMAYLRPERFVTLAVGTLPKLEAAFAAAVLASGARLTGARRSRRTRPTTTRRRSSRVSCMRQVPGPLLEQVGELSTKLTRSPRQRPHRELARGDRPHGEPRRLHRRERLRGRREGHRHRGREPVEHVRQGAPARPARVRGQRAVLRSSPSPRPARARGGHAREAKLYARLLVVAGRRRVAASTIRARPTTATLKGRTVVKWTFNAYPERGFPMDSCVDFGVHKVAVDVVDADGLATSGTR